MNSSLPIVESSDSKYSFSSIHFGFPFLKKWRILQTRDWGQTWNTSRGKDVHLLRLESSVFHQCRIVKRNETSTGRNVKRLYLYWGMATMSSTCCDVWLKNVLAEGVYHPFKKRSDSLRSEQLSAVGTIIEKTVSITTSILPMV